MINHNGNFPNLDGIENGGLSGLSTQCLMVDLDPLIYCLIDSLQLFTNGPCYLLGKV